MVLTVSEAWKAAYPGASVGILAMRGVVNPKHHPSFDNHREELEKQFPSGFQDIEDFIKEEEQK